MLAPWSELSKLLVGVSRTRWVLLIVFSLVVSLLEILGALFVVVLLRLITAPQGSLDVPVLGDPRRFVGGAGSETAFVSITLIMACFFVFRGAVYLVQVYIQNRITHNAGARLSTRLLEGYINLPYSFHLRRNSAELIRNATSSVSDVVSSVFVPAVSILSECLIVLGILTALILSAPLLTMGGAAGFLITVTVALKIVQPRIVALGQMSQEASRTTLGIMQQSLHGIRDIKLTGNGKYFLNQYAGEREALARAQYLRSLLSDTPRVLIETTLILMVLVFLIVTVTRGGFGSDVLVPLGLFTYAALRLLPSINRIVANLNNLRFGTAAIEIINRDLAIVEADVSEARTLGSISDTSELSERISLTNVVFTYEEAATPAICNVSLEIERGELVGLIGATGGGKSTLIDLITGLLDPQEGEILVDGQPIAECRDGWQRQLGVVSQTVVLFDTSIRQNIAFGIPEEEIDDDLIWSAVQVAQLDELVSALPHGVDTVVGERGVRLSGGQRQRIAIARALYRDSPVLIFDEGTSGLDNVTEAALIRALERLKGTRTIIAAAHRLTTLRTCSRIIVMDGGRITDIGSFVELAERNVQFQHLA